MKLVVTEVPPPLTLNAENMRYTIHHGGRLLGIFRTPFMSAPRVLIADGVDPDTTITMHWSSEDAPWALRSTVGKAAKLTVRENKWAGPTFAPYWPGPGPATVAEETIAATSALAIEALA